MSTPATTAPATKPYCPIEWVKGHATPFHLTIAAALGLATVGFVALIAVLILVDTNFSAIGWIE